MNSVELFSGAGGLALGIAKAGFHHEAIVELDKHACATIRKNQSTKHSITKFWPLHEKDVAVFDYKSISQKVDLLAGGPPCQPFSLGGKHRGMKDCRNMFPEMFRATLELKPRAIFIENVRGLSRPAFSEYFNYIILQLTYPELTRKDSECWFDHSKRLQRHARSRSTSGLTYRVSHRILNAADYGVPQCRERLFIVAFRSDIKSYWEFPVPTHSFSALLWQQWMTGEYWDRHNISSRRRPSPKEKHLRQLANFLESEKFSLNQPWKTVRDAIYDLPNPLNRSDAKTIFNHIHNPGARSYPGHTGSHLDLPAKTLKAGSHGVPGGENMLNHGNGRVRYFTVRECARLQTFPDNYIFPDVWCTAMRQLGNAVPVRLAEIIANSIASNLVSDADISTSQEARVFHTNSSMENTVTQMVARSAR